MTSISNSTKYGFEFLSIFIAVISAFALNNWNENRKNALSENKILTEISNGLKKDLVDIKDNIGGHHMGIAACDYFREAIMGKNVNIDSFMLYYYTITRDFINIQNIAGYETLKSRGLELIKNDSLRLKIITIYEYEYNTLRKLEEEYSEMQFHETYFKELNEELAPNFKFTSDGKINGIHTPLQIQPKNRNKLLVYFWKIKTNRSFILEFYSQIEREIKEVIQDIDDEIKVKSKRNKPLVVKDTSSITSPAIK
ncbi:MAG: hypothetical protein IPN72_24275 [Saprospiraceae bacterium]|nr:hypothetical protein [Saprospiraceae bacterium]